MRSPIRPLVRTAPAAAAPPIRNQRARWSGRRIPKRKASMTAPMKNARVMSRRARLPIHQNWKVEGRSAAAAHLARDLRLARLVGIEDVHGRSRGKQKERPGEEQQGQIALHRREAYSNRRSRRTELQSARMKTNYTVFAPGRRVRAGILGLVL